MHQRTAVVLGTRPEIIKLAPVIGALKRSGADFYVIHSGQHYSYMMDEVFFKDLKLDAPAHNLGSGSGTHAEETAKMLVGIERVLTQEPTTGILVEGDTNTVLAGAIAASKLGVRVGHVESGLRSGDMRMPEEVNRILTDHVSDVLFAPTTTSKWNLLREGISASKVRVTGNTIVDSLKLSMESAKTANLEAFTGGDSDYLLATVHRAENVDSPERLEGILDGLEEVGRASQLPVVYPVHPRAAKAIKGRRIGKWVRLTEPADYFQFLKLEMGASLILTDSGGVQEEACVLKVPCVTLRDNTERPETVEVGANMLAGADPKRIARASEKMMKKLRNWKNPFGDGRASEKIVKSWLEAGA